MDNSQTYNGHEKIDQEVISDNQEIFNRITKEIQNARSEILIASAWFTDKDIFNLLLDKAQVTSVSIIIGDNEDNNKIDFERLSVAGGKYLKVKNAGFGIMHQKFCVIDRKLAIHGSYNFTHNARNNNHESVIVTNHPLTVKQLIEAFYTIQEGIEGISANGKSKLNGAQDSTSKMNGMVKPMYQAEYEKVLNTLIDAEINNFDRKALTNTGFKRSESCLGDVNVLPNALDTVFYNFLNDVQISSEQKDKLLSKVSEQKTSHLQLLDVEHNGSMNRSKIERETRKFNLGKYIEDKKFGIGKLDARNEEIRKVDIKNILDKIDDISNKINEERLAFVKPRLKWFDFVPIGFIALVLFVYLALFYSSAAYILLFSVDDTMKAIKTGAEIPPHQVFEPKAIPQALAHGGSSIFFIVLFVFVPIAFALADRYTSSKFWKIFISFGLGIFLIDSFLAYTVAKSIFEIKVLTGEAAGAWQSSYAFSDANFYLVFVMGAAALLVFKFIFNKIMSMFEERNPDIHEQKSKLIIKQFQQQILDNKEKIKDYEKEIESNKQEKIRLESEKRSLELEMDQLPIEYSVKEQSLQSEYSLKKEYYNNITEIFNNRIENNQARISVAALRDRINIFLEGWNDYLFQHYAYQLATQKSRLATDACDAWLGTKIEGGNVVSPINGEI